MDIAEEVQKDRRLYKVSIALKNNLNIGFQTGIMETNPAKNAQGGLLNLNI